MVHRRDCGIKQLRRAELSKDSDGTSVSQPVFDSSYMPWLINTEESFLAILSATTALVLVIDLNGRIVWLNRAAEKLTDFSFEQEKRMVNWNVLIEPDDIEAAKSAFEELWDNPFSSKKWGGIVSVKGKRRLIEWFNTVLLDQLGKIKFFVATGMDVTEQVQESKALQRSHDELLQVPTELRQQNEALMKQFASYRQAEKELKYRIAFENLITALSTKFISLKSEEIDKGIEQALREISEFTNDDRSWVILYHDNWTSMENTHEWCANGIMSSKGPFNNKPVGTMPWVNERIRRYEVVQIQRIADLPPEAGIDKALLQSVGNQSNIFVPMIYRGTVIGCLGIDSVLSERTWSEEIITLLKAVGEMFVNALERKWVEEELQESQLTLTTLMSNLPGMAYRLRNDKDGEFEFVSEGCLELTGYTPSELMEDKLLSYFRLVHPEDRKVVMLAMRNALREQKPYCHVHRILTATKEVKWVWEQGCGVVYPYRDNMGLEGFITDATDRVLAFQRLEERVEQRTREIERRRAVADGLREVMAALNESCPLPEVLDHIVAQAGHLLCTETVAIYKLLRGKGMLDVKAGRGLRDDCAVGSSFSISGRGVARMMEEFEPLAIPNEKGENQRAAFVKDLFKIHDKTMYGPCHSLLFVPLIVDEEIYGALILYYTEVRSFSSEDMELATTFGHQATLAIENAWLRVQAEENATAKERNRIASDLHDSVTQTLFAVNFTAEALPCLLRENALEAQQNLEQLQLLTRGALAEMRELLLELRPAALKNADLDQLLRYLVDSYATRGRLPILLTTEGHRSLPTDVQIGLYRIVQEALNNLLRHANATRATTELRYDTDGVTLKITDDGCGFDPSLISMGHMGLTIMRERAAAIGALLLIDGQTGRGTEVLLIWPEPTRRRQR